MEDFFDVKSTIIDGNSVSLFGIFDGLHLPVSYLRRYNHSSMSLTNICQCRSWWFSCCRVFEGALI